MMAISSTNYNSLLLESHGSSSNQMERIHPCLAVLPVPALFFITTTTFAVITIGEMLICLRRKRESQATTEAGLFFIA